MVALPASGRVSPPGDAVKLTSLTARVVPYCLVRFSMVIMCQLADFGLMGGVGSGRVPLGGSAGRGEPDRFGADLPEPRSHGLVVAARGGPGGCAADEVPAADLR